MPDTWFKHLSPWQLKRTNLPYPKFMNVKYLDPVTSAAGTYQPVSPRLQLNFSTNGTGCIIYCRIRG